MIRIFVFIRVQNYDMREIIWSILFLSISLIGLQSQSYEKTLNSELTAILLNQIESTESIDSKNKQVSLFFEDGFLKVKENKILANDHLVFKYEIPLDEIHSLTIKGNNLIVKSQNLNEGFRTVIDDGQHQTISMQHEVIIGFKESDNQKLFNCIDKGIKFQKSLEVNLNSGDQVLVAKDSLQSNQTSAIYGYMENKLDENIQLNGKSTVHEELLHLLNNKFGNVLENNQLIFVLTARGIVDGLRIISTNSLGKDFIKLEQEISADLNEQTWTLGAFKGEAVSSLLSYTFVSGK